MTTIAKKELLFKAKDAELLLGEDAGSAAVLLSKDADSAAAVLSKNAGRAAVVLSEADQDAKLLLKKAAETAELLLTQGASDAVKLLHKATIVAESLLVRVKVLEGLITICSYCKKIKNLEKNWLKLEQYLTENSNADFSHGICADCYKIQMDALDKEDLEQ